MHQVYSGLGYTMPRWIENDQLPVIKLTQILVSIGLLSSHPLPVLQGFFKISVFCHRPTIPTVCKPGINGVGEKRREGRGTRKKEEEEKGREIENIFFESLNQWFLNLTYIQITQMLVNTDAEHFLGVRHAIVWIWSILLRCLC